LINGPTAVGSALTDLPAHRTTNHPLPPTTASPSLINPPYCAWRFVGNHDAWNVAFPDMRSMYHVMQMNMGTCVRIYVWVGGY
jgi:hypothetical protein